MSIKEAEISHRVRLTQENITLNEHFQDCQILLLIKSLLKFVLEICMGDYRDIGMRSRKMRGGEALKLR